MSEATIEDADFEPVEEATKPVEGPVERVRREVESYVARIKAKAQNSISKAEEKAAKKLAAVEEREAEKLRKAALKEQQRAAKEAAALQAAREVKQTSSVNIARPKAKSSFSFVDFLRDIFTSSKAKAARREARREAKTLELLEAREKFFKRDDAFFENGPKTPEVNGQDSWHAKSAQKRAVRHAEAAQKEASKGATTRRFFANKNISADTYLDAVRLKRASTPTKVAAGVAAAFAATEVADEVSSLAHTYKRAVPSEDVHISPEVTEKEPLLSREELDALLHEAPDADEALQKAARNGFNKPYDPKAVYVANLFAEEAKKPKAIEDLSTPSAGEPEWEAVSKNEQKLLENKFPNRLGKGIAQRDLG
ncbi:MAG: hypothetical protein CMH26_06275 [Micavibrio sp.]|nr:hypothetical protein [Micavibrio sp.]